MMSRICQDPAPDAADSMSMNSMPAAALESHVTLMSIIEVCVKHLAAEPDLQASALVCFMLLPEILLSMRSTASASS